MRIDGPREIVTTNTTRGKSYSVRVETSGIPAPATLQQYNHSMYIVCFKEDTRGVRSQVGPDRMKSCSRHERREED